MEHQHQILHPDCKVCCALRIEWDQRLKRAKFQDAETPQGNLKDFGPRNKLVSTQNAARIRAYFMKLDRYLQAHKIPRDHRMVLELYTKGTNMREISRVTRYPYIRVRRIVDRYKKLVLAWLA